MSCPLGHSGLHLVRVQNDVFAVTDFIALDDVLVFHGPSGIAVDHLAMNAMPVRLLIMWKLTRSAVEAAV